MEGAKELYEQERQMEIDFLSAGELQERQALYCSGCQHNWSSLLSMEAEGDEEYEYCPICGTDEHITDGQDGPVHSFNPITGEVLDAKTGEVIPYTVPEPPPVPKDFDTPWVDLRYKKADQEQREDELLDEYFKNQL